MTPHQVGDQLVGLTEIGQRAGVQNSAVANWRARHAAFPTPIATLDCGPIFWWPYVERWLRDTGRTTDANWSPRQVHPQVKPTATRRVTP